MQYTKQARTYEEQADLLISRKMLGDRSSIINRLSAVNYYRLAGYWHPFQDQTTGNFQSETTFDMIWNRYVFDRQLRLLVLDAIERIEVYLRSGLANALAMEDADPFAYIGNPSIMPCFKRSEHAEFVAEIIRIYGRSKGEFVTHFSDKYGDCHSALPIWMAVETMTFGMMRQLYTASSPVVKSKIAVALGVHDTVLSSWIEVLNIIRNMAAHHGRLWNRTMGIRPKIPQKDPAWHRPVEIHNDRMFGVLSICRYCLKRIAPQSSWQCRLEDLFAKNPSIPIQRLGFPANWKSSPIWQ
ncbi:MAG: Abi family protein [Kiritimatiellia bacterium]